MRLPRNLTFCFSPDWRLQRRYHHTGWNTLRLNCFMQWASRESQVSLLGETWHCLKVPSTNVSLSWRKEHCRVKTFFKANKCSRIKWSARNSRSTWKGRNGNGWIMIIDAEDHIQFSTLSWFLCFWGWPWVKLLDFINIDKTTEYLRWEETQGSSNSHKAESTLHSDQVISGKNNESKLLLGY